MMKSPKSRGSPKKEIERKPGFLEFRDLPEADAVLWLQAESIESVEQMIKAFSNLKSADSDIKEAAILDFYTSAILWCREKDMSPVEVSVMFAICKQVLTRLQEGARQSEVVIEIKQLLSGGESSSGLEDFPADRLQELLEYFFSTALQHFSLYSVAMLQQPEQVIITRELPIDSLPARSDPFPPPLCEGMPQDLYRRAILRSGTSKAKTNIEVEEAEAASQKESATPADAGEGSQQQFDLEAAMQQLSAEEIQGAVDSVCQEMLAGLEADIVAKIKDREMNWIGKINKLHNVA